MWSAPTVRYAAVATVNDPTRARTISGMTAPTAATATKPVGPTRERTTRPTAPPSPRSARRSAAPRTITKYSTACAPTYAANPATGSTHTVNTSAAVAPTYNHFAGLADDAARSAR